jgi:uncharacterized sodium:solute symporter family permease YidK
VFIPIYYRHGVISIYEFLETRFGSFTRKLASMIFLITRVLAMGTRLYVSAIIVVLAVEMWRGGQVVTTNEKVLALCRGRCPGDRANRALHHRRRASAR